MVIGVVDKTGWASNTETILKKRGFWRALNASLRILIIIFVEDARLTFRCCVVPISRLSAIHAMGSIPESSNSWAKTFSFSTVEVGI